MIFSFNCYSLYLYHGHLHLLFEKYQENVFFKIFCSKCCIETIIKIFNRKTDHNIIVNIFL